MFDGLDPKIMLMTAVVFLLLLLILNSVLYKPMLEFIRKRDENIKADESRIAQNQAEATNSNELVGKIIADAKSKAYALREEELSRTKLQAERMIADFQSKLSEKYEEHLKDLEEDKVRLKNELAAQLQSISACLQASLKRL